MEVLARVMDASRGEVRTKNMLRAVGRARPVLLTRQAPPAISPQTLARYPVAVSVQSVHIVANHRQAVLEACPSGSPVGEVGAVVVVPHGGAGGSNGHVGDLANALTWGYISANNAVEYIAEG